MDELASPSYVPLDGELIYDKTENNIKVEDGSSSIPALNYIGSGEVKLSSTGSCHYPIVDYETYKRLEIWMATNIEISVPPSENYLLCEEYTYDLSKDTGINNLIALLDNDIYYSFGINANDGNLISLCNARIVYSSKLLKLIIKTYSVVILSQHELHLYKNTKIMDTVIPAN